MSITAETAKEHAHDPAVLCCRAEAGITIEAANLEDPAIFDDLVDSGLLNLDGALTIEEVLGAKLTKTCDSLCPLTADVVEGAKAPTAPAAEEAEEEAPAAPAPVAAPVAGPAAGGTLKIHIGEGKDIDLEIPVGALGGGAAVAPLPAGAEAVVAGAAAPEAVGEEKVVRSLTRKHFTITEVKRGPETKIEGTTLYIREGIEADVIADQELVKDFKLEIITPELYHTYSETVMDVQPIATKEGDDELGAGVTRVLDGVVMMLTGVDEGGVQIGEFGSSEGYLDENIMWNRPSCPDKGEIFIKGNIVIQEKTNMERRGPMAAHTAFDVITQEIREVMKKLDDSLVADTEELKQVRRPGKKKVVIVKEIMGQGAMHDNFILPVEPVGVLGARANVDLGNVPVCVSPLEVLDGCIHALTCIGPASKEMSRHYWREPLVLEALHDPEVDLCGVVFVGSPQINAEKFYVSRRVGHTVEMMDADGAFVTTEGFGNNHIDFASHIEQIGMRGIPVVGMSYCAVQGALVVGNKYMTYMVDNNKSEAGIENEILGNNTLCPEDAVRALAMLKTAMAGEDVKAAEKKWNPNVKSTNVELIESTY
ncbi:D-proline reductase (dithiol) proprotein PrdA, partial [[Clostridium] scindens]|uniref:D-proline reductase (dithiol) proprotein PrdA n=1 Tax=Clostridium scindens (strain JCM 10418 / VPI 12708) TaxID=29347 RepID=UPI003AB97110